MGFNTALTGLNAAQNMLAVTGNNIANANTIGFKKSRSEFADAYTNSMGGKASTTPGSGVQITSVAQQFSQGNMDYTDNSLDIAVNGEGFFILGDSTTDTSQRFYTRNGAFHLNEEGYAVNHLDQPLLVYPANGDTVEDGFSTGLFSTLKLDTTQSLPRATTSIDMNITLDTNGAIPDAAATPFDPADPTSFTWSNSATVFDSLGNSHTVTSYFTKTETTDEATGNAIWAMQVYLDGTTDMLAEGTSPIQLAFDTNGRLTRVGEPAEGATTLPTSFQTAPIPITNANPLQITIDLAGSTQLATKPSTNSLAQDGLPIGNLTGVDVDKSGIVFARYSNGASIPLGQVALARFQNPQGMNKMGDSQWSETINSGSPITGVAGTSSFGLIKSGALESANVDIAAQLVTLIVAQQAYQANAQSISTENTLVQAILNIR